ncbi:MAG: class I SAM-dependent methyltransferase [Oceanicaulis sp.]
MSAKTNQDPVSLTAEKFPIRDGVVHISPDREYKMDREKAAHHFQQYMNLPIDKEQISNTANRFKKLFSDLNILTDGSYFEIGCGTGRGTFPFVQDFRYDQYLITDGMREFVDVTKANLERVRADAPVTYGVMTAEEIDKLPDAPFSLIVLFACLHHISDWRSFIQLAADRLAPGGALIMAEPVYEYQLVVGTLMSGLKQKHERGLVSLSQDQLRWVQLQINSADFMSSRIIDKEDREDKWTFRVDEVMMAAVRAGLQPYAFPGVGAGGPTGHKAVFSNMFKNRLKQLRADDELIETILEECSGELEFLDKIYLYGLGPHFNALYILRKPD